MQDLIACYEMQAAPLQLCPALGRTEAAWAQKHRRLLCCHGHPAPEGHRHTIRFSLTPEPAATAHSKSAPPRNCSRRWLPCLRARGRGLPRCGRTTSTTFQNSLATCRTYPRSHARWKSRYTPPASKPEPSPSWLHRERPGESQACRHRHFAPRNRRSPRRPHLRRRRKVHDAARPAHFRRVQELVEEYIEARYARGAPKATASPPKPNPKQSPNPQKTKADLWAEVRPRLTASGSGGAVSLVERMNNPRGRERGETANRLGSR